MIKGAVSVCSMVDQTSFLYHARFPDLSAVNLYGNSSFLPCKSGTKVPDENHILLLQVRDKLTPRAAYSMPPEREDAQRQSSPHFCDDQLFVFPENDGNPKELKKGRAASRMQPSIDLQQIAEKQGNQVTILDKLETVHLHILAMEQWNASRLKMCHQNYSASAINVLHYLALKSLDTEQIEEELSSNGLMNLETICTHVLSSLVGCIEMLINSRSESLLGSNVSSKGLPSRPVSQSLDDKNVDLGMTAMVKKASSNRDLLFGKLQSQKMAHIMVTVGQEAAENDTHITDLEHFFKHLS